MRTPNRILVPVDFSPCSATALEYAAEMAHKLGATLDVLHVWQAPHVLTHGEALPPLAVFAHTEAGQQMKDFLARLEHERGIDGSSVRGRLAAGDPAQAIIDVAEAGDYDLIIMGRHGRGAFHHFFMGSVAERVSRRAKAPVLTLHASMEAVKQEAAEPVAHTPAEARS